MKDAADSTANIRISIVDTAAAVVVAFDVADCE